MILPLKKLLTHFIAIAICAVAGTRFAPAQVAPTSNLDDQLLDDGPAAQKGPLSPTPERTPRAETPRNIPSNSPGVPPESADGPSPFGALLGKMELVERRLTAGLDPNLRALQDEIVADLDEILNPGAADPNSRRTAGGSAQKSQQPPGNDPAQNPPQPPDNGGKPGAPQTGEGAPRSLGSGTGDGIAGGQPKTMQAIAEESWGSLPRRERARILEAGGDEIPPQYERSLRKYFLRLVEERPNPRRDTARP